MGNWPACCEGSTVIHHCDEFTSCTVLLKQIHRVDARPRSERGLPIWLRNCPASFGMFGLGAAIPMHLDSSRCNTIHLRCYTLRMPTTHRRHAITETEEISAALSVARRVWPHLADKPGALLRRLILTGRNSLLHDFDASEKARREAIEVTSGAMAGVFGPDYLADLREDWPE